MNTMLSIIENGEQFDITAGQAKALVKAGLIYDSGEGYFHLEDGVDFSAIEQATR